MSYQVFARKYRPQTFADVVGQDHITRTLKSAITQQRLAHAYLFVGPRGTGKTSTARILSKCLCCIHAPTIEPCGVCDPCREIAGGNSMDVLEIDGASNNGVEQVRELRDNVRYAPTRGKYKIYIIDEVHMLSSAAFNALLKTLEEPPDHVKFIFATTEVQKVLPTILSRCQRFDLRRIPGPLIAAHLQKIAGLEGIQLAADAGETIARGAEGGLRDAESMLDQLVAFCGTAIALEDVLGIFGFTAPEIVARMAGFLLHSQTSELLALLDEESESGKDLLRLLSELISHLRNLLIYQVNPGSTKDEVGEAMLRSYEDQAATISPSRLLELIDQFAVAENRMKWAPNKKLPFEIALIKAVQTLSLTSLDDVIDALTALRGESSTSVELTPTLHPKQTVPPANGSRPSNGGSPPGSAASSSVGSGSTRMDFTILKRAVSKPVEPAASSTVAPANLPPLERNLPPPAVAEISPAPEAKPSVSPLVAEPIAVPGPDVGPLNAPRIWRELVGELRSLRPLITAWVQSGKVYSVEGGKFRVGFPTDQRMILDSLSKPANRKLLEELLTKLAGRPVTLLMELRDDLPELEQAEEPASLSPVPTAPLNGNHSAGSLSVDPIASFKNDPLIKKALEIFEGEIRPPE